MADEITVDGTTYYRAGGGWRMRGARDVAVGPRFCALLDEIAQLRAERDAARKDAETLRQGLRAFERTLDVFDEITLSDYLGGVGVDDITQRIVMAHGDDVMHDVGSMEELLAARVESWRYSDALLAEARAARAAEGGTTT